MANYQLKIYNLCFVSFVPLWFKSFPEQTLGFGGDFL